MKILTNSIGTGIPKTYFFSKGVGKRIVGKRERNAKE
jgi:hypothetical protein